MDEALAIHARFSALPGSEQIATLFAIAGLQWWLRRTRPRYVAEWGTGIGTLTDVILSSQPLCFVWSYEPDERFIEAAKENVRMGIDRIQWLDRPWPEMRYWPGLFDMLVIDGSPSRTWIPLNQGAIVFVEGGRRDQRRQLEKRFGTVRRWCRAEWKPKDRSKGFHIYLLDPLPWHQMWFAMVRFREWMMDLRARWRGEPIGKRQHE